MKHRSNLSAYFGSWRSTEDWVNGQSLQFSWCGGGGCGDPVQQELLSPLRISSFLGSQQPGVNLCWLRLGFRDCVALKQDVHKIHNFSFYLRSWALFSSASSWSTGWCWAPGCKSSRCRSRRWCWWQWPRWSWTTRRTILDSSQSGEVGGVQHWQCSPRIERGRGWSHPFLTRTFNGLRTSGP